MGTLNSRIVIALLVGLAWLSYSLLAGERTIINCLQCGKDSCIVASFEQPLAEVSTFPLPEFLESALNEVTRLADAVATGKVYAAPPRAKILGTVHVDKEPTLGVIMQSDIDGAIWIVFRGSRFFMDWTSDVRQHQCPFEYGGLVHAGFVKAYESTRLQVLSKIPTDAKDVILTGHSLGAALATVLALAVKVSLPKARISLATTACPRVGDDVFCATMDREIVRHVTLRNDADVVPTLPSAVTLNFRNPFKPFVYSRCGRTILFCENWKSISNNHHSSIYLDHCRKLLASVDKRASNPKFNEINKGPVVKDAP